MPSAGHVACRDPEAGSQSWKRGRTCSHNAKGDSIDVEVDQRAAYLASAGQVDLGYGVPVEMAKVDPEVFAERNPLWAAVAHQHAAGGNARRLTQKLPLPHEHMHWTESRTFWATTLAVNHLMEPVSEGGAGLGLAELD